MASHDRLGHLQPSAACGQLMTDLSLSCILIYAFVAGLHSYYADDSERFRSTTKPLLMPLLSVFYLFAAGDSPWIYGALLFAWLGDLALLKQGTLFFMLGLVSFLAGHLLMSTHLLNLLFPLVSPTSMGIVFVVMFVLAAGLFNYLRPHLGTLQVPVLIYCLVLATKGSLAVLLVWQTPNTMTVLVAIGALVFMASDLTLAVNRFVKPIHKAHLWVMASYTLAQGMMVVGLSQAI